MPAPHDYTMLALTFEHHNEGGYSEKVPPHVSVMPWFDARSFNIADETAAVREATGVLLLRPLEEKIYGVPGHEKPGRRIVGDGLKWLHISIFQVLVRLGAEFSDPQWLGRNYEPHYTFRNGMDPLAGVGQIHFDELAVIKNIRNGRSDRYIKTIDYLRLG